MSLEIEEAKTDIYIKLGYLKLHQGKIKEILPYLKEVKTLIGDDTLSSNMIDYYMMSSHYYGEQHNMAEKLRFLKKAKSLTLDIGAEAKFLLNINYSLSVLFESLGAFQQALDIQDGNYYQSWLEH